MSFLPPVILALLAAACAAPLVMALVRARGEQRRQLGVLAALRLPALALVVLAALNPSWDREAPSERRPRLVVLLDASASMGLPGDAGRTRWQQAQETLRSAEARRQLQRFEEVIVPFGPGLIASPDASSGPQAGWQPAPPQDTDIALALRQVLARYGPQAILLVSDGAETSGEARETAAQCRAAGVAVCAAGVGATEPPPNVGPLVIQAPRVAREKQPIPVRAVVRSTGYAGEQPLLLAVDDKPAARLTAELAPGATVAVRHQLAGLAAGFHLLTLRAPARSDEVTAADNVRHHLLEVRRDETRLVLLAGAPGPDYAALRRLLGRLPKTKLEAYVRLGPGKFLHQRGEAVTREAPVLGRLLGEAHVLVLMDYPLSSAEGSVVGAFVRQGGALGWLAGKQSSGAAALGAALPATPGAFQAMLTPASPPTPGGPLGEELGRATSPLWWRHAPFLSGAASLSNVKPGGEIALRGGSGQPLLVAGSYGVGATLIFAGAGTQRWLLSAEADTNSRRLYEAFWGAVTGWLSQPRPHSRLAVMVDPPIAPAGRPVRLIAALSGQGEAQLHAEITGPQTKLTVPLSRSGEETGRYAAGVSDLEPGKYTVRFSATMGSARLQETRQLVIEPGGAELAETTQQAGALKAIAEAGGGQYAPVGELAALLAGLPATGSVQPVTRRVYPFRSAAALAGIVLLLSAEWWLRRRWGW